MRACNTIRSVTCVQARAACVALVFLLASLKLHQENFAYYTNEGENKRLEIQKFIMRFSLRLFIDRKRPR